VHRASDMHECVTAGGAVAWQPPGLCEPRRATQHFLPNPHT
jgi:hypothetical protein